MSELLPLGLSAWIVIATYLLSLIGIGFLAKRARTENTLTDFYLGGRNVGLTVLFLTLFATTYSGNVFFAFTGSIYRVGYVFIYSLHFMIAIVVVYQCFAPKLKRLADEGSYVTPVDYLADRFNSKILNAVAALTMCVALCNYLLAQLMAMGRAMEGLAGVDSGTAFVFGVVTLALIMVIYGTLGGLRAVAWTDTIQGVLLLTGLGALLIMLFRQYGTLEEATLIIQHRDAANGTHFASPPSAAQLREWLSYVLIVGFGAALYPQAIQRIYAARSPAVLNRSLRWMVFMPLIAIGFVYVAGVIGLAYIPGLQGPETDQVLALMMRDVQLSSAFGYWLVVVLICAVLAAMMSTADSALLSISSMLSKDIAGRLILSHAPQAQLTRIGKICSWVLLFLLVLLAISLQDQTTLIRLLDRKFDLLIQLAPAFIIGLHWRGMKSLPTTLGFIIGVATAVVLAYGDFSFVDRGKINGFHPGLIGLVPNLFVAVIGSAFIRQPEARS